MVTRHNPGSYAWAGQAAVDTMIAEGMTVRLDHPHLVAKVGKLIPASGPMSK